MISGELIFYSGAGLLVLTVLTAIVFYVKRPQYVPENVAFDERGSTQRFQNGYPTARLTKRWQKEPLILPETEKVPETGTANAETEKLNTLDHKK